MIDFKRISSLVW